MFQGEDKTSCPFSIGWAPSKSALLLPSHPMRLHFICYCLRRIQGVVNGDVLSADGDVTVAEPAPAPFPRDSRSTRSTPVQLRAGRISFSGGFELVPRAPSSCCNMHYALCISSASPCLQLFCTHAAMTSRLGGCFGNDASVSFAQLFLV